MTDEHNPSAWVLWNKHDEEPAMLYTGEKPTGDFKDCFELREIVFKDQQDAMVAALETRLEEKTEECQSFYEEAERVAKQRDQFKDRLKAFLDTRNAEARASMALANAKENFTDAHIEQEAYFKAMVDASNAEKLAREALADMELKESKNERKE